MLIHQRDSAIIIEDNHSIQKLDAVLAKIALSLERVPFEFQRLNTFTPVYIVH